MANWQPLELQFLGAWIHVVFDELLEIFCKFNVRSYPFFAFYWLSLSLTLPLPHPSEDDFIFPSFPLSFGFFLLLLLLFDFLWHNFYCSVDITFILSRPFATKSIHSHPLALQHICHCVRICSSSKLHKWMSHIITQNTSLYSIGTY